MTKEKLEKEAEEYIKANNLEWELECHRTSPIGEVKQAYLAGAEPREKRIAELEAQLESERDLPAIAYIQGAEKQKKKDTDQLTKAKEIIRDFISVAIDYIDKEDKNYSYIVEAEQFLNREVEK